MASIDIHEQLKWHPSNLRKKYGDEIGNEITFLRQAIKNDRAIRELMSELDVLSNIRQAELIDVVWKRYYMNIADRLLTAHNDSTK